MQEGVFKAGVQPGGLTSHDEVKMLICYILSRVGRAMSFADIHETLDEHSLVNYFELVQAMEGLEKTGHVAVERQGEEQYAVTDIGRQAGEAFESTLPLSVREKAVSAAEKLLRRRKRESEVKIDIRKVENGYVMELAIPEAGENLTSFTLFLPTREECELVRRRFLNDPVYIYKGVLALLTGDQHVLGKIFPPEKPLY